jgi:Sigma-70 factor, region 1.1
VDELAEEQSSPEAIEAVLTSLGRMNIAVLDERSQTEEAFAEVAPSVDREALKEAQASLLEDVASGTGASMDPLAV